MRSNSISLVVAGVLLAALMGLAVALLEWHQSVGVLLFGSAAALFLVNFRIGTYALIFLVVILGKYLGWSIDVPGATMRNLIPFYLPTYVLVVAALAMHRVADRAGPRPTANPLNVPILLLVAYSIVYIMVRPTGYHLIVWSMLCLNVGLYYLVVSMAKDEMFHRRAMWCWAVAGNILAGLVVVSIVVHPQITHTHRIFGWLDFVFNYSPDVAIRGYAIGHPNHTSMLLNMSLAVMIGLFICQQRRAAKCLLLASIAFCVFANFLTMSKAGLGAMWVMMLFIIFASPALRKNAIRNTIVLNAALVLLFGLSFLFSSQATPRLLKVSQKGGYSTSVGSRLKIWQAGWDAMQDRSLAPFGLGPGGFDLDTQFPHSHNFYLSFFFDFGIVGLICICLIMLILLMEFFIVRRAKGGGAHASYIETMLVAFKGGLVVIAVHSIVDHTYIKEAIWVFLGFAVATLLLVRTEWKANDGRQAGQGAGNPPA